MLNPERKWIYAWRNREGRKLRRQISVRLSDSRASQHSLGFLLEDEEDLHSLRRLCREVEIDPLRSIVTLSAQKAALAPPNVKLTVYAEEAPVEQELPRAQEAYVRTEKILEGLVQDVQAGSHLHVEQVDDVVDDLVESVVTSPDALMWIARLQELNCDVAQGYAIARPMSIGALGEWRRAREEATPAP